MRLPSIRGVIDRRILVNYRVEPDVLAKIVPPPFRPQVIHGFGMAGICLIRLRGVRPRGLPGWMGLGSENAAHRIAVEWEDERGHLRSGVYILRRDTNSRLNVLAGGRLFPGIHHHGTFRVREKESRLEVAFQSDDRRVSMKVSGQLSDRWPRESVFRSLAEASSFFEAGSLGYSPTATAGRFQGLELCCDSWDVQPLAIKTVRSSLFDDPTIFPRGSIELDSGLAMRDVEHQWQSRQDLCCAQAAPASAVSCCGCSASTISV
jgi:uncharacterized protein DUF2071